MQNIIDAITTKISGSALAECVGGRVYYDFAPDSNEYPRVVWQIIASPKQRTFTEEYRNTLLQFSLMSSKSSAQTEISTMYSYLSALLDECLLTITGSTTVWMRETNLLPLSEDFDQPMPDGSTGYTIWAVDFELYTSLD